MSAFTDDIDAAAEAARGVFTANGMDTTMIDTAYSDNSGPVGLASYAWASNGDRALVDGMDTWIDPLVTSYAQWQTGRFWEDLRDAYSNEHQVSDKVSAFLDSATTASSVAVQSQASITPTGVGDAIAQTGLDIANDAKKAVPWAAIAAGVAVFLWATR